MIEPSLRDAVLMASLALRSGSWDEWVQWWTAVVWFGAYTDESERIWN